MSTGRPASTAAHHDAHLKTRFAVQTRRAAMLAFVFAASTALRFSMPGAAKHLPRPAYLIVAALVFVGTALVVRALAPARAHGAARAARWAAAGVAAAGVTAAVTVLAQGAVFSRMALLLAAGATGAIGLLAALRPRAVPVDAHGPATLSERGRGLAKTARLFMRAAWRPHAMVFMAILFVLSAASRVALVLRTPGASWDVPKLVHGLLGDGATALLAGAAIALIVGPRARLAAAVVLAACATLMYANLEVYEVLGVQFGDEVAALLHMPGGGGGWSLALDAMGPLDPFLWWILPMGAAVWAVRRFWKDTEARALGRTAFMVMWVFSLGAVLGARGTLYQAVRQAPGPIGYTVAIDDLPKRALRAVTPTEPSPLGTPEGRTHALKALSGAPRLFAEAQRATAGGPADPWFTADVATLCTYGAPAGFDRALCTADRDGDGTPGARDCDDMDPAVHPGATDNPGDGLDQDCSGADAGLPDLVVIHVESLGALDMQPLSDMFSGVTPSLAKLSKRGVLFQNAFSNLEPSDHARSSYFLGTLPVSPPSIRTSPKLTGPTLPDGLAAAGYRVANILAAPSNFQGMRGYFGAHGVHDVIDRDTFEKEGITPPAWVAERTTFIPYSDAQVLDRARRYLKERQAKRDGPTALFIATGTSHWPWPVPPEFADFKSPTGRQDELYAERHRSIRHADAEVGRFVTELLDDPAHKDTVVLVFGDHPPFKMLRDAIPPNIDAVLSQRWVPLMVFNHPRLGAPGTTRDDVVSLVDLPPTLLSLIGSRMPHSFVGRDVTTASATSCAVVGLDGTDVVCPKSVCHKTGGSWRCTARTRGAYITADPAEKPALLDRVAPAAAYTKHLVKDVHALTPAWFSWSKWKRAHAGKHE